MKISQVNLYIARAQSTLAKRETNLCKQILFPFRRRNLFVLLFCWVFFFFVRFFSFYACYILYVKLYCQFLGVCVLQGTVVFS